jgi:hypothetical protein
MCGNANWRTDENIGLKPRIVNNEMYKNVKNILHTNKKTNIEIK